MITLSKEERAIVEAGAAIKRDARKAATKARPKSLKADRGKIHDRGFLAFLRRQRCEARRLGGCSGPIQAAHVRYSDAAAGSVNPGMQRKNHDRHANPICEAHHIGVQHQMNERKFWASLGKDAYATAAAHYARYLSGEG